MSDAEGTYREVSINDLMTVQLLPPQYVISPLIPRNQVTLMGGHGGSGKSLVGLSMACHVADGKPWDPFEVQQGRVLIVSLEDTADILRYRLRHIINDCGLDPKRVVNNITLLDCTELVALAVEYIKEGRRCLKLTSKAQEILNMAQEFNLVLIDNASDAYAADENVRHLVRAFIRMLALAIRPSQGAILLLAHIDKAAAKSGGGGQSYSGSTAWHNSVRSRLAIAHGKLMHEKHQFGPLHPDVVVEFNKNGVPLLVDDATIQLKAEIQLESDKTELVHLLEEAEANEVVISTSIKGPNNVWGIIAGLPGFPRDWKNASGGRRRMHAALKALEAQGVIRRERYTSKQRNKREKWILVTSSVSEEPTKETNEKVTN